MRTLIVGQAPSSTTRSGAAFPPEGRSGRRLRALVGPRFDDAFATTNLLPRYLGPARRRRDRVLGPAPKGDRFDIPAAREAARRLDVSSFEVVVLCGRAVAKAFDLGDAPFLRRVRREGRTFVVFPHPSGVSTWWNDRRNVAAARRTLRALAA